MIISAEVALITGAVALYLYDTIMLLYSNEVLLVHGRRRWRASLGSRFMLGGRFLALPRGLVPGTVVFRGCWGRVGMGPAPLCTPLPEFLRALRPLQWASRLMAVLLFAAIPACLIWRPTSNLMLALVLAFYGMALGCCVYLVTKRKPLGLQGRMLSSAVVDVLACPPFAVNVVRRVTLAVGPATSPDAFAQQMLTSDGYQGLCGEIQARLHLTALAEPAEAPGMQHSSSSKSTAHDAH